jgi:hypothetical protein
MQGRYENKNRETAVSEVIGAVMLIAVVVTAIAVIGVALTSQSQPEKIPALDAIISSNGKDTIRIFHNGGDSLTSQQIAILVDGVARNFTEDIQGSDWTTWSQGQFLDYNYGSLPQPGKVQLIYKSPTTQTVLVSADFSGGMPTYVPTTATNPEPAATVSGISPPAGTTGTTLSTTVSGSGFVNGATAKLTQGSSSIAATNVMVISQGQLTCTFSLNGAATGQWNVVVTNPSSPPGTLTGGFTVVSPGSAPTVISISPNSAFSGSTTPIRNLTGTNFVVGTSPTVKLSRSGNADFFATSVQVLDTRNISCTLTIPAGTTAGAWDVMVINSDGQSGTLSQGFMIYNPGPVITGITPASGTAGTVVSITNLAGTGFTSGTTVMLNGTSFTDIPASNVVVINSRQITCSFDLSSASTGTRNVVVSNADGTNMLANGFVVGGVAPSVYSIAPNNGVTGTTLSNVLIGGTGFIDGATVTLRKSGSPDINATTVSFGSATSLTGTFVIPPTATLGQYDVIVSNPDGKYGTLPASSGFTVNSPLPFPTVISVAPASGPLAGSTPVIITGTYFTGATGVTIGGTAATAVTVVSDTSITATTPGHAAGAVDVVVTTPNGTATGTGVYTYVSAVPTFTSIAPSTGPIAGGTSVTITGSGFTGATGVTLGGTAATSVTVVSDTSITATTPFHSAGVVNVIVTTPGGTATGTNVYTYTITAAPTFTSIAPATGPTAGSTAITITGTNFVAGGLLGVTIGGVPATSVARTASTTITAVTPAGTAGAKDVVVTNNDGQTVTRTDAYTYRAVPTFTGIAPAAGPITLGTPVTITGTGFTGATGVTLGGTAATAVTVISDTLITATAPAHAFGVVNVVVTTPGGTATGTGVYTYIAAPTNTLIVPAYGRINGGTAVTITGTNFVTGATAVTFGGTEATTFTVVSATSIIATTPAHAAGAGNVVVTTPGGATAARTYTYANPTISGALSRTTGVHGTSYTGITIPGTYFITSPYPTVRFTQGSNTMTGTVTACTQTQVTFSLSIPSTQALGSYDVTATNTDGGSATRTTAFSVT